MIFELVRIMLVVLGKLLTLISVEVYWPLCRLYARILGDKPSDGIYRFLCSLQFSMIHRFWPNFKKPSSFNEKIWARMLYVRDPMLTLISDKLKVREYVTKKVGDEVLIPLLWVGLSPKDIPYDNLPSRFVIKTNHGCGYNIIVKDKKHLNKKIVEQLITNWLSKNFCLTTYTGSAWGYKNIEPMIMIEEFLEENGKPPLDYKFFCFSGRVEYLQINFDRFGDASERILDRHFNVLDVYTGVRLYDGPIKRPENYDEMIRVAETLSAGFDFIRVDLYNVNGKIYFGELTCYPAGGLVAFVPRKWDFIFGEKWILENKYK
mgnify:FL=1